MFTEAIRAGQLTPHQVEAQAFDGEHDVFESLFCRLYQGGGMRLLPCKALLCLVSGERCVATWPLQAVKHGKNVLFGQEVRLAVGCRASNGPSDDGARALSTPPT